jgi:hypothetical protein
MAGLKTRPFKVATFQQPLKGMLLNSAQGHVGLPVIFCAEIDDGFGII